MVYVGAFEYKYRGMIMSKMIADSLEELHAMADKIGVNRKHFQDKKDAPHYDICRSKKQIAISLGAKQINDREIVSFFKNKTK